MENTGKCLSYDYIWLYMAVDLLVDLLLVKSSMDKGKNSPCLSSHTTLMFLVGFPMFRMSHTSFATNHGSPSRIIVRNVCSPKAKGTTAFSCVFNKYSRNLNFT